MQDNNGFLDSVGFIDLSGYPIGTPVYILGLSPSEKKPMPKAEYVFIGFQPSLNYPFMVMREDFYNKAIKEAQGDFDEDYDDDDEDAPTPPKIEKLDQTVGPKDLPSQWIVFCKKIREKLPKVDITKAEIAKILNCEIEQINIID